mmetsp:Transcript_85069/g.237581  ORF Transcript_85069/g.237581 Transcript_85069/m.237581 type:complete len:173 (+) Transcript_85069:71-589(+)
MSALGSSRSDAVSCQDDAGSEASWLSSLMPIRPRERPRPDFNGVWLCRAATGDVDDFLRDLGIDHATRAAASEANYGVGHAQITIGQADEHFVMKPAGTNGFTQRFIVNGRPQVTEGSMGPSCLVPSWEGDVLRLEVDRIVTRKYRISGQSMVCEATSAGGASATWHYSRKL